MAMGALGPIHFIILGLMMLFIGGAIYTTLPPPGYTHNPMTGAIRGIAIVLCVFGTVVLLMGILPTATEWAFGSDFIKNMMEVGNASGNTT